jgi:hypothetical protein
MVSVWDYNGNNISNNSNKINKVNNKILEKQIPTEYNEEQTLRFIRKQDQIPGEGKRSKTINDTPNTAALAQLVKDLDFPADKSKIVQFIQQKKTNDSRSNRVHLT